MEQKTKPQLRKVLMLADFACATGFAQIAQHIAEAILKTERYQLDIVGINYYGMPTEWLRLYPLIRLFPATLISGNDFLGRQGFLNLLSSGEYDLTFILQDTFNIEELSQKMRELRTHLISQGKKKFKSILYYPIDAKPKENWITKAVCLQDFPVVYTQYGFDHSVHFAPELKNKLKIIPHGYDPEVFKPLDEDFRTQFKKNFFTGKADNKFIITNINRNQPRKDIARTLQIFKSFKQIVPNSLLYLHMKARDVAYDINEVARNFELIPNEDYIIPPNFDEHNGAAVEIVNAIYNVSDIVMTTTLGEGWGLSMTEAMAAKRAVIAPNHTSLTEMLADGRGMLVNAGKRTTDWVTLTNDNERMRPIVDVPEYVDKLVQLHNNKELRENLAKTGYEYVTNNLTWEKVGKMWVEVFDKAYDSLTVKITLGRNDPCHCGSGKKYKYCHINE